MDSKLYREQLAARMAKFQNNCHDPGNGQFCGNAWHKAIATKGTDAPVRGQRAYWLADNGKFVPFNTHLDAIQDEDVSGAQEAMALHANFARKEKAVRLSLNPDSADIEIWTPMTEDQVSSIVEHLRRSIVNIESHNVHIPDEGRWYRDHPQRLLKPSTEEMYKALDIANRHAKGRDISKVATFLSEEELIFFRTNSQMSGWSYKRR